MSFDGARDVIGIVVVRLHRARGRLAQLEATNKLTTPPWPAPAPLPHRREARHVVHRGAAPGPHARAADGRAPRAGGGHHARGAQVVAGQQPEGGGLAGGG
jgi:hypothetical protein